MTQRKRWLQIGLGVVLSVAAFVFAARDVDGPLLWRALRGADYVWLAPALLLTAFGQLLRAWRWRLLFHRRSQPTVRESFSILSVGYLVSTVFPMRLGDPVRAWAIGRYTRARTSEGLATVLVERALDLLTVVLLLAWVAPTLTAKLLGDRFGAGVWDQADGLRWLSLLVGFGGYLSIVVLARLSHRSDAALAWMLGHLPLRRALAARIQATGVGLIDGLAPLARVQQAVAALAISLAIWLTGAVAFWQVMLAFRMGLSPAAGIFVLCAAAIAAILPSTPGYVGVFHAAVVAALRVWSDVPADAAFSYALVVHLVSFGPLLVLGPIGLRMLGLSAGDLQRRVMRTQDDVVAGDSAVAEPGADGLGLGSDVP